MISGWIGTIILCLVLAGVFFACGYAAWQKIGPGILASPEYFVGPQQFDITPPPPCLGMQEEVYQDLSRQGPLRIMDNDLVGRVADAFPGILGCLKCGGSENPPVKSRSN